MVRSAGSLFPRRAAVLQAEAARRVAIQDRAEALLHLENRLSHEEYALISDAGFNSVPPELASLFAAELGLSAAPPSPQSSRTPAPTQSSFPASLPLSPGMFRQSSRHQPPGLSSYTSTPSSLPLSSFPATSSSNFTTPPVHADTLSDHPPTTDGYSLRSGRSAVAAKTSPPPAPKRRRQDASQEPQEAVTVIQRGPDRELVRSSFLRLVLPNRSLPVTAL